MRTVMLCTRVILLSMSVSMWICFLLSDIPVWVKKKKIVAKKKSINRPNLKPFMRHHTVILVSWFPSWVSARRPVGFDTQDSFPSSSFTRLSPSSFFTRLSPSSSFVRLSPSSSFALSPSSSFVRLSPSSSFDHLSPSSSFSRFLGLR